MNTVAHRIQDLNDKEAREKENNTPDPRQEMDSNNPLLYTPCERDPPWLWPRIRQDNTYLRKEWAESPHFSRYQNWFRILIMQSTLGKETAPRSDTLT